MPARKKQEAIGVTIAFERTRKLPAGWNAPCADCHVAFQRTRGRPSARCPQCRDRRRRAYPKDEHAHELIRHHYSALRQDPTFQAEILALQAQARTLQTESRAIPMKRAALQAEVLQAVEAFVRRWDLLPYRGARDVLRALDLAKGRPPLLAAGMTPIRNDPDARPLPTRHRDPAKLRALAKKTMKDLAARVRGQKWLNVAGRKSRDRWTISGSTRARVEKWAKILGVPLTTGKGGRRAKRAE